MNETGKRLARIGKPKNSRRNLKKWYQCLHYLFNKVVYSFEINWVMALSTIVIVGQLLVLLDISTCVDEYPDHMEYIQPNYFAVGISIIWVVQQRAKTCMFQNCNYDWFLRSGSTFQFHVVLWPESCICVRYCIPTIFTNKSFRRDILISKNSKTFRRIYVLQINWWEIKTWTVVHIHNWKIVWSNLDERIINETNHLLGKRLMKLKSFRINNPTTFPKRNNFLFPFLYFLLILLEISIPWVSVFRKYELCKSGPLK